MTPAQLLDEVKARFYSLLHNEPQALNVLLKQALGAYQDRAGVTDVVKIKTLDKNEDGDPCFSVPSDFLARVTVKDKYGKFVISDYNRREKVMVLNNARGVMPLSLMYFVDLSSADIATYELPNEIVGLIKDYLEMLIAIPNAERNRRVAIAGNLDVSDIPAEADLFSRKIEIETRMSAARCALPLLSI